MQGRLSPMSPHGLQAFPAGPWEDELPKIRSLGLDRIEWLLDRWAPLRNPLVLDPDQVADTLASHGVSSPSLCLDAMLACTWNSASLQDLRQFVSVVFPAAATIGVEVVCLPFLDDLSLESAPTTRVRDSLLDFLSVEAGRNSLSLALETSLSPQALASIIHQFGESGIQVTLDIGNLVAASRNVSEFVDELGPSISVIHLKDRDRKNEPVLLGQGVAQVSSALANIHACKPKAVTLECFRGINAYEDVSRQVKIVQSLLNT